MDRTFALLSPASDRTEAADSGLFLYQAEFAMTVGRHGQADELLGRPIQHHVDVSGTQQAWAIDPYLQRALNLDMAGRFEDAEQVLAAAPRLHLTREAMDSSIPRMLARIRIDRGDAHGALAVLPVEGTDNPAGAPEFGYDDRLRGEILCQLGEWEKGLRLIEDSVQRKQAKYYEHHPDLARAHAVAGLCALSDGQRKRAEAFAARAHASFIAQPDVSPYFKDPLEKLDHLLESKVATR